MLAPHQNTQAMQEVWSLAEVPELTPPLFPFWNVLLVETNHERRAAEWLLANVRIVAYWPNFPRQYRSRGKVTRHRTCAVIPGLLFVPLEFMDLRRRDEVLPYVHAYGFVMSAGNPALLTKAEVEIIREIEARLNLPDDAVGDAVGKRLEVGQRVRFLNEVYAAFFGDGAIREVASKTRIGVEVAQLFGGPRTVFVPAAEIEVM